MMSIASHWYEATITSDASGWWECGAFWSDGEWFQLEWPDSWIGVNITIKELLPIVVATCTAMWGKKWRGNRVKCRCDNAAVVAMLRSGSSKGERAMHLLRILFLFLATYDVFIFGEHIPGIKIGSADSLSRDNHRSFLLQVPQAQQELSPVL